MKRLLSLLLTVNAMAALTTITESHIAAPDGTLASGYITITADPAFTAADGTRVEIDSRIPLVNGRFSVQLEPTDTGVLTSTSTAVILYRVTWHLTNAAPRTEHWAVPTTVTVLGVKDVLASPINQNGSILWVVCMPTGSAGGGTGGFAPFGATWPQAILSWTATTIPWSQM